MVESSFMPQRLDGEEIIGCQLEMNLIYLKSLDHVKRVAIVFCYIT